VIDPAPLTLADIQEAVKILRKIALPVDANGYYHIPKNRFSCCCCTHWRARTANVHGDARCRRKHKRFNAYDSACGWFAP
jgi:hypothetical protein